MAQLKADEMQLVLERHRRLRHIQSELNQLEQLNPYCFGAAEATGAPKFNSNAGAADDLRDTISEHTKHVSKTQLWWL